MSASSAIETVVDDAAANAPEIDPDILAPEYRGENVDLEVSRVAYRYGRTEVCLRCDQGLECKHSMTILRPKRSILALPRT